MLLFPNAKINLGLNVLSRRPDNYHNLETVFYPIPLSDALEVVEATHGEGYRFIPSGRVIDGDANSNLVVKAWRMMKERFELPPLDIYLHKIIPFGAGLGGGSADAAYMLRLLRDLFSLPVSDDELAQMAATLGADCPFFIHNKPLLAGGIGDQFSEVNISLKGYHLVLIKPEVSVSTPLAYSLITPTIPPIPLKEVIAMPLEAWRTHLVNDFEKSIFTHFPLLATLKEELYAQGAIYAAMSGSGSSLFGIFAQPITPTFSQPDLFVWQGTLE